ncbi:WD40 repeat [Spirosoma fluviale]|uniref:WD40 repeat n=1 Tax=Spirosoma fluviale TaxID=1597977 RepID=A0A286GLU1_9BACT|nr:WD40 repeat [Spirosoma fluviale]
MDGEDATAFTPDGHFFALAHHKTIQVFNRLSGKLVREITIPRKEIRTLAFSPDGTYLAAAGNAGSIWVWNWPTEIQLVASLPGHRKDVNSIAFSPDGNYIASGSDDETVRVWEWRKRSEIRQQNLSIKGVKGWFQNNHIRSVGFSPDGRQVVCGGTDEIVWVWPWLENSSATAFEGHSGDINQVLFLPDGESVMSASDDKTVRIWSLSNPDYVRTFPAEDDVSAVAYQPGYVLLGQRNGLIRVHNEVTKDTIKTFDTGHRRLRGLTLSRDGWYLLSVGTEKAVYIWEWASGVEQKRLQAANIDPRQGVECLAISPDSRLVLAGGRGTNNLRSWQAKDGRQIHTYKGFRRVVKSMEFSPNGQFLAISSTDSSVYVYETNRPDQPVYKLRLPVQTISLDFSPDGQWLALGRSDGIISLWDWTAARTSTDSLKMPVGSVECVRFYDNKFLVSSGNSQAIIVWDWRLRSIKNRLIGHTGSVYTLAFSPDKQLMVSGGTDNSARVWNWEQKRCIDTVIHQSWVRSVCFSTDGQYVVSSDQNGTILRWAPQSPEPPRTIAATCKPITAVRFSPDRQYIFSGSNEPGGRVSVWWSGLPPVVMDTEEGSVYVSWVGQPPAQISAPTYTAHALLIGADPALKDSVKLYLNAQPVTGGKTLETRSINRPDGGFDLEKSVQLSEGTNTLQWRMTRTGLPDVVSSTYTIRYTPPSKPNLFVFAFGIVNQSSDLTPLLYTVPDAIELAEALKQQRGKLFDEVDVQTYTTSAETSCQKIRETFEEIGQMGDKILPKDLLIVFISGHGQTVRGAFRIAGSDYSNRKASTTSVDLHREVFAQLAELECKKLILLDACHSGDAKFGSRTTPSVEDTQRILANLPPQSVLITSSKGDESSWEDKSWGHGAFTKALLEAIEGRANKNDDQTTTVRELYKYLEQTVPTMVQSLKNKPQTPLLKASDANSQLDKIPLFWHGSTTKTYPNQPAKH